MTNKRAIDINEISGYNTFVNPDSASNLPSEVFKDEDNKVFQPRRDEFNQNSIMNFSNTIGVPSFALPITSGDDYKVPSRTIPTPGEMYNMTEYRDNLHQRRTVRIASAYLLKEAGYMVYLDRSSLQTDSYHQEGTSLPGDNSYHSTVSNLEDSPYDPDVSTPSGFQVDILPGSGASSAKVMPANSDYRNKTAKTYAQIIRNLHSGVGERSKGLKVYKEHSNGPNQSYRVAFKPEYDGFTVDILTEDEKHPLDSKMLALKCNCPAWRFHGSEYWANQEGYLLGKTRGSGDKPKSRDPKARNKVCKHVVAVFNFLKKKKK
jgi:hypothetical protein